MLRVEELGFAYPEAAPLFSGVSFEVGAGESVALAGRNGAGKSTLFRLINGLLTPSLGRVFVNGVNTRDVPVHVLARTMGTVFQSPEQQIFEARVSDEVAFGPRHLGLSRTEASRRAAEAIERVGLTQYSSAHPMDLDRAARRFVAIASVLSMKPRVLLLDEPQLGLDFRATQRLEKILADEKAGGVTLVFVSHDMDFVARNADRVLVLGDFRLLAMGSPISVFSDATALQTAGLEIPAALAISTALGLPAVLRSRDLVAAWITRLQKKTSEMSPGS